jgi:hypothetical protein
VLSGHPHQDGASHYECQKTRDAQRGQCVPATAEPIARRNRSEGRQTHGNEKDAECPQENDHQPDEGRCRNRAKRKGMAQCREGYKRAQSSHSKSLASHSHVARGADRPESTSDLDPAVKDRPRDPRAQASHLFMPASYPYQLT